MRVDEQFADVRLAAIYDAWHPPVSRADYRFYLSMALAAERVLDIGCGTGSFLAMARDAGHTGRLIGVDPAQGMIEVAQNRADIEWVLGLAQDAIPAGPFDFIVMTGHAFQAIVEDSEIAELFLALKALLAPGGRFAFETRNPGAREWERWVRYPVGEFLDPAGGRIRARRRELSVTGELVSFEMAYTGSAWDGELHSASTLRFLRLETLNQFIAGAGMALVDQWGDWDRSPVGPRSPEIITILTAP